MRAEAAAALLGLALLAPAAAQAQGAIGAGAERLEERVDAVGRALDRRVAETPVLGELAERVRISGSWLGAWFDARPGSQVQQDDFSTWDARLFADVELGRDLALGTRPLLQALGVRFEWEFARLGQRVDDYGEFYLDLQGVGGSSWLNAQVGRFQIPVGESYLRFSMGYRDNPFLSNTVGGAWWADEGVRIHGSDPTGRFAYVASVSSGETALDSSADGDGQATLKLIARPTPWLQLSASGLWSAPSGSDEYPADGALWLGETWARAFGAGAPGPNVHEGAVAPDAPGRLDGTWYLGADAVLTHPRGARLWLSYGLYRIDSSGPSLYDRTLHTWIAELVLEGRLASPVLRPFYLALRANGLGTYDGGRGYLLDVRYTGRFGYNMQSLEAYSLGVGWRLCRWATLKLEYTYQDADLVGGAGGVLGARAADASYWGAGLGLAF